MPMFSCTSNIGTFHIVIYESTNYIENHIANKPACVQWQGGTATQGIHNLAGTIGIATPGRNSTTWTTQNNSYRWTPSGPTVTPTLTWYQVGNPNPFELSMDYDSSISIIGIWESGGNIYGLDSQKNKYLLPSVVDPLSWAPQYIETLLLDGVANGASQIPTCIPTQFVSL